MYNVSYTWGTSFRSSGDMFGGSLAPWTSEPVLLYPFDIALLSALIVETTEGGLNY